MQKDFHYYCIAVLARAAGINAQRAHTIAYASQYVDDSTEGEPISVGDVMFDPVRTAYLGLKSIDWSIQKRVYIPFHFIPAKPVRIPRQTFITIGGSPFALEILQAVSGGDPGYYRLCRLGIALHTYADTWAHQGFSGREHKENDVENISHLVGRKWKHMVWQDMFLDILPEIGHAQAGIIPDQSFRTWKYLNKSTNTEIKRNNTGEFIKAASHIYKQLLLVDLADKKNGIPWKYLEPRIRDLLADTEPDLEKRCDKWREAFGDLFYPHCYEYNHQVWRNDALNPSDDKDTGWDKFKPSDFRDLHFSMKTGFWDSPWVQFHRAALKQRHFVLENLI